MHKYLKTRYFDFLKSFAGVGGNDTSEVKFKGADLKKIRRRFNLSQKCFAVMLGISVKTLQNYEIDRTSIPGTARSLFIFADENISLFQKYYLKRIDHLKPYRESMNGM